MVIQLVFQFPKVGPEVRTYILFLVFVGALIVQIGQVSKQDSSCKGYLQLHTVSRPPKAAHSFTVECIPLLKIVADAQPEETKQLLLNIVNRMEAKLSPADRQKLEQPPAANKLPGDKKHLLLD